MQREIVIVAAIDRGHQFRAHAVGVGTAHVIAFQQNLVAAADTHHAMAEIVEARGLVARSHQMGMAIPKHDDSAAPVCVSAATISLPLPPGLVERGPEP